MRLVLDTNVIMELLHWHDPRCAPIAAALAAGRATGFTDAACLAELERVAGYPQFALDAAAQAALLARYRSLARAVDASPPAPPLPRCRDADDQKFLELAARCAADLLITRDKELLRLNRRRRYPNALSAPFAIVTPEQAAPLIAAAAIATIPSIPAIPAAPTESPT